MDGLKLDTWKERFEMEMKNLQAQYASTFKDYQHDLYSMKLDESHEWQLQVNEQVPKDIKSRIEQLFLAAKPEDSV